jgi:hypothetical protein
MTTERDELATVIETAYDLNPGMASFELLAHAVLAAGYRKPQEVTTLEELDALPFETVIRDAGGHVLERWGQPKENLWATVMFSAYIPRGDIALPATVLHVGGAE